MALWIAALVVVAVAALTRLRVRARVRAATRAFPPEGRFVTIDGRAVHVVQSGAGPDVVLVHGSMGSTRDVTFRLMPALVKAGFRVTALDRPGLGYSQPLAARGVTLDAQADHLERAAQALDLGPAILVGQSFGGAVVTAWTLRHPGRAVALVSIAGATHPWLGPLDLSYRMLSWPLVGPVLAHLVCAWMRDDGLADRVASTFEPEPMPAGFVAHFGPRVNLAPIRLVANAQQRTELRAHLLAQSPRYGEITCPVEAIHGDADPIVGADIHSAPLVRDVADGVLTRLPGAGHMPHQTETSAVVAAIQRAALRAGHE